MQFIVRAQTLEQSKDWLVRSEYYGLEQGLSHRNVEAIQQDEQGFMWFGTNYGLNRFDGYHFKWFTKEKQGLQTNMINHILKDDSGLLWLFNTGNKFTKTPINIDIFNPVSEEVVSFEKKFGKLTPCKVKDIVDFIVSKDGRVALLTSQQQLIFYSSRSSFDVVEIKTHPITLACFSNHNTIYAYSTKNNNFNRNVILEIDLTGKVLHRIEHKKNSEYFIIAGVDNTDKLYYISKTSIASEPEQFDKGTIYSIDKSGTELQLFDKNTKLKKELIHLDIQTFANECNIWMNQDELNFCLFGRNSFQLFNPDQGWQFELSKGNKGLTDPNIVFFDNNNRTWVGTQFGIYQIQISPNPFHKILNNSAVLPTAVRGILEDDNGHLWIGSDRGQYGLWIQLKGEQVANDYKIPWKKLAKGKTEPLPFVGYLYSLFKDNSGSIWLGSGETHTIYRIDTTEENLKTSSYIFPDLSKSDNTNIWSFYEDDNRKIWFGTDKSKIGFIDQQNKRVVFLDELYGVKEAGGCIYQFLKDRNGKIWIATDNGLFNLNTQTNQAEIYRIASNQNEFSFLRQSVYYIHEDKDGSFWIATAGSGLFHWNPGTTKFQQFTKADGLSDNTIYAVYEDDFNNLWMPSDYGIIQFNKITHRSTAYLEHNGISNNEFNRISHYKNKDGTIYFGGLNGITYFNPNDLKIDSGQSEIPLVITSFQQFDGDENKLIDKRNELIQTNTIILQPNDRYFRLEFSLLNYENERRNQYAYKMVGIDADWIYQNENTIHFSRLPYGNHKLQIKGQSSNGQWSNKEILLNVIALKPIYLQNWFVSCTAFFLILGSILFYYTRIYQLNKRTIFLENKVSKRTETIRAQNDQLEKQADELLELDKMKSRFFANVSHELRTPLTLMLGPIHSALKSGELSERNYHFLDRAQKNGKELLKLIKSILHLSTMDVGKMEFREEHVYFFPFLRQTISAFESLAESLGIHLAFEFLGEENLQLQIDRDKVKTILENFIMNALKFTSRDGHVTVRVEDHLHVIKFAVSDTGRGIHKKDLPNIFDRFYQSKEPLRGQDDYPIEGGLGIGLALCNEFATIIQGKIWVESELNIGSSFYLEIPRKEIVDLSTVDANTETEMHPCNQSPSTDTKPQFAPTSTDKEKILVVEDNRDLRDYLISILSPYYEVITAENGIEALSTLNKVSNTNESVPPTENAELLPKVGTANCQLILSDIMMPIMDGFQFLEKLKSNETFRHIPFIMLTARADIQDKLKALRIGVDDYLIKPFDEEELLARISNLLSNAKTRKIFLQEKPNDEIVKDPLKISNFNQELSWLENLENLIRKEVKNDLLSVSWIAQKMFLSERQLNRRIKSLTGLGPIQYIREIRLQEGRKLIEESKVKTVKEAALAVCFKDEKYFSQLFFERFGKNPSDFF